MSSKSPPATMELEGQFFLFNEFCDPVSNTGGWGGEGEGGCNQLLSAWEVNSLEKRKRNESNKREEYSCLGVDLSFGKSLVSYLFIPFMVL